MLTCRDLPRTYSVITPLARGLGRHYVLARIGMSQVSKPNEDITWCEECGRYFNPKVGHACIEERIKDNRFKLEQFLGRYKVKGEN